MKDYVYTLWTKPLIYNRNLYQNIVYLVLSVILVKKNARTISIYTDTVGAIILNEIFSDININTEILNTLNDLSIVKWSIPKLYTIQSQTKPFCHLDHDVFLWDVMPHFEKCDIVTQSAEITKNFAGMYQKSFENYKQHNLVIDELNECKEFYGYNCGYLDIYNIDVSNQWVDFALKIEKSFNKNFQWIDCILVEQFSLNFISKKKSFKIEKLFNDIENIDVNIKYTHLMGAKQKKFILNEVEKKILKLDLHTYIKLLNFKNNEFKYY
jgi:hypothetical protein